MASTYTVSNAVTFTQAICVGVPVASIQMAAADMVNSTIWNAYPWRWAQKAMTPIALVDGTQDYTFAPTDYMRLVAARLVRTDVTPDEYDELDVVRYLAPDLSSGGFQSGLRQIAYNSALTKLRLTSAAAVPAGTTFQIQGEYQYQPTKITNMGSLLPFPDQYFHVFCEGLLWMFFRIAKDSREGTASANGKGGVMYTGQMGVFYDALTAMIEAEETGAGDNIFPAEPIGALSMYSFGI